MSTGLHAPGSEAPAENLPQKVNEVRPVDPKELSRRSFLMKVGLALNAIVVLAIATPVVRYIFFPVRGKDGYLKWISLGPVDNFKEGETQLTDYRNPYTQPWDGETGNVACYVRRESGNKFTVFAVNCAHLNCPVRWFPQSQLFMCPCHGGVYYSNGDRAAGPPERGLFTYPTRVENGSLMIDAGQMPTLANDQAKLVKGITPCPGTNSPISG